MAHKNGVRVPDRFETHGFRGDHIDSQVRCRNCGAVCTVGVEYGETADEHSCGDGRPMHEDAGFVGVF